MSRLADIDEMRKRAIRNFGCIPLVDGGFNHCKTLDEFLIEEPLADAEITRHGHWIELDHGLQMCSECGEDCREEEDRLPFRTYGFCPYCGAKMDEKTK